MNLPVEFLSGADADSKLLSIGLRIAAKDLVWKFMAAVEAHLTRLAAFPLLAPVYHETVRRQVMLGFPDGIFYEPHPTRLIVIAILDLRQAPEQIRRRLR